VLIKRLAMAFASAVYLGYRDLAEKLTAMGLPETERNIANKVSRGGFTAAFFVQCLDEIGAQEITLRS
jgi:hypothetical protein